MYHEIADDFVYSYRSFKRFILSLIQIFQRFDQPRFVSIGGAGLGIVENIGITIEFEKGVSTLRSFCLRRAESISGQLKGTIPSTSEGQTQDSSALIDASDLVISDMGTMGEIMKPGNHKSITPSASDRNARTVPPSAVH